MYYLAVDTATKVTVVSGRRECEKVLKTYFSDAYSEALLSKIKVGEQINFDVTNPASYDIETLRIRRSK